MNFVGELKWRGMLHDVMPGTEEQLNKEMTSGYLGIDPTADSLHIGHLVGIMLLKHFQISGHKPIALVGGATGMIGDPSGKSQERNLLTEEILRYNQECIKRQLSGFLDFESDIPNVAVPVSWMLSRMPIENMSLKFFLIYGSFYLGNGLMSIVYIWRFRGERWKRTVEKGLV